MRVQAGCYLLHGRQVVELDTVDLLLLQHQLLEVLSSIWLPLKGLESLGQQGAQIMDRSTWGFPAAFLEAKTISIPAILPCKYVYASSMHLFICM